MLPHHAITKTLPHSTRHQMKCQLSPQQPISYRLSGLLIYSYHNTRQGILAGPGKRNPKTVILKLLILINRSNGKYNVAPWQKDFRWCPLSEDMMENCEDELDLNWIVLV